MRQEGGRSELEEVEGSDLAWLDPKFPSFPFLFSCLPSHPSLFQTPVHLPTPEFHPPLPLHSKCKVHKSYFSHTQATIFFQSDCPFFCVSLFTLPQSQIPNSIFHIFLSQSINLPSQVLLSAQSSPPVTYDGAPTYYWPLSSSPQGLLPSSPPELLQSLYL